MVALHPDPLPGTLPGGGAAGMQQERTNLAWIRTVLGYLVVATVALRTASVSDPAGVAVALAYLGVAIAVALWCTARRDRSRPPALEVLALSAVTAALALHWLWMSS